MRMKKGWSDKRELHLNKQRIEDGTFEFGESVASPRVARGATSFDYCFNGEWPPVGFDQIFSKASSWTLMR